MAKYVKRFIGDAIVSITYVDPTGVGNGSYMGSIKVGDLIWKFDNLLAPVMGFGYDSPKAYDIMARSAVSFGSYYDSHNQAVSCDVPSWAPAPEVADAIGQATDWAQSYEDAESGYGEYVVRRSRPRYRPIPLKAEAI